MIGEASGRHVDDARPTSAAASRARRSGTARLPPPSGARSRGTSRAARTRCTGRCRRPSPARPCRPGSRRRGRRSTSRPCRSRARAAPTRAPAAGGSAAGRRSADHAPRAPMCDRPRHERDLPAPIAPAGRLDAATTRPSPMTKPVTSQCSTMSTPRRSAPRRVAPRDLVVPRDAAPSLERGAVHRVAHVGGDVDDRAELARTSSGVQPLGVDAVQPVRVHPAHARRERRPRSCARFSTPRWLNCRSTPRSASSPSHSFSECS